ncbi:peroxiredoxin family protein [Desulfonatronum thiodismutans]|uniref:peroxiredoxin family protein n=1 Tax=Desulfonatronum thiodismutans TaxID=159290 RepID=UPI0006895740|nr:redoxin family protein [Desulfonatronum thiodismutans]
MRGLAGSFFVLVWLSLALVVGQASAMGPLGVGERHPEILAFAFPTPEVPAHRAYLSLGEGKGSVALADMDKDFFLIEIVGVYCPVCHNQAPDMLRLYQRIQRDADLAGKVAMVAVAAGATPMEIEHLHRTWRFPFPILQDGDYALHKMIGEPDTPYTLLVDRDGSILFAHLGRTDIDNLFNRLKQLP